MVDATHIYIYIYNKLRVHQKAAIKSLLRRTPTKMIALIFALISPLETADFYVKL